ncbi:MAG: acyltransferase, partial [Maritimibacter sp.]|nr:acyltransferase [Maritimibacter sp.]
LISSIILDDIEAKRFSILRFYERRARRILPALFFTILLTLPFAWAWMLPSQIEEFARSAIWVSFFASNVYFWRESGGYFTPAAEEAPLMHTWSLSIEEQFYIFFPIYLFLLWRFGRRPVFAITLTVALASLGLAEWASRIEPNANFFLLPTRVWELMAGALAAIAMRRDWVRHSNAPALFGLLLIAVAVTVYDDATPFPGLYAAVPVAGTVLFILFGGERTVAARMLGHRVLVGLGLISYSAYLLHQPVFALTRTRLFAAPEPPMMLALTFFSFALAYVSWRFVEQPFRGSNPLLRSRGPLFAASLSGLVVLGSLGVAGTHYNGFPGRMSQSALELLQQNKDRNPYSQICQLQNKPPANGHPVAGCGDFMVDGTADVVFIGDSHSDAVSHAAQVALKERGISSYAFAAGGCPPILGVRSQTDLASRKCETHNLEMREFARRVGAGTIVVTSRFALYYNGTRFTNSLGGAEHGPDTPFDAVPDQDTRLKGAKPARQDRLLDRIVDDISSLATEFNVVLVYPIPEMGWNIPRSMARCDLFGYESCDLSIPYSDYLSRTAALRDAFDALDMPELIRVDPASTLCEKGPDRRCAAARDGKALYFDSDHLANSTGAVLLAELIANAVTTSVEPPSAAFAGTNSAGEGTME